jgi:hypothetical protein
MTDCALAAPATTRSTRRTRRTRGPLPPGVPRWAWLFGVTVVPLGPADPQAAQGWVVSAGAGTTHAAAVLLDDPDHD